MATHRATLSLGRLVSSAAGGWPPGPVPREHRNRYVQDGLASGSGKPAPSHHRTHPQGDSWLGQTILEVVTNGSPKPSWAEEGLPRGLSPNSI